MDTATDFLFIIITKENQIIDSVIEPSVKKHSDLALYKLQDCLTKNTVQPNQIEMFCVGAGPGSYSGIRIARTIAKMFHLVNKVPIFQFSTLAFLQQITGNEMLVLHAGKDVVYARSSGEDKLLSKSEAHTLFNHLYQFDLNVAYPMLETLQLENAETTAPYYIKAAL